MGEAENPYGIEKKGIKSYDIEQALEELGNDEILEKMEYLVLKAKTTISSGRKVEKKKENIRFFD